MDDEKVTTMTTSAETPQPVKVTIALEPTERDRLESLAFIKQQTTDFLMQQAIHTYLDQEESDLRFVEAAHTSLQHYKETGLHMTHDEFSQWVDAVQSNPGAPPPTCHS
jgi:predicted transcriptional regulator